MKLDHDHGLDMTPVGSPGLRRTNKAPDKKPWSGLDHAMVFCMLPVVCMLLVGIVFEVVTTYRLGRVGYYRVHRGLTESQVVTLMGRPSRICDPGKPDCLSIVHQRPQKLPTNRALVYFVDTRVAYVFVDNGHVVEAWDGRMND